MDRVKLQCDKVRYDITPASELADETSKDWFPKGKISMFTMWVVAEGLAPPTPQE